MARHVNDDARELIRERIDLRDLVAEHVELRRSGGDRHVGLCPFHAEKTPSFSVYGDDKHFHCFGCGAHGGVFDFLMRVRGVPFRAAFLELAQRVGIPVGISARSRPFGPTLRQRAATEREAVFEELRELWRQRAQITHDAAGSSVLEAFAIDYELPEIAERETELIVRFYEETTATLGVPRGLDRTAA